MYLIAPRARLALSILLAAVLELGVTNSVTIWGATGSILVPYTIAVAIVGGPEHGAIVGFASGLIIDLYTTTPFGLTALVYTILGYVIGVGAASLVRSGGFGTIGIAIVGSLFAVWGFVLVGVLVGQDHLLHTPLLAISVAQIVFSVVLVPIGLPVARWALVESIGSFRSRG